MNRTKELKEIKRNLQYAVDNHYKLKNSYYLTPCSKASGRRAAEKRNCFEYVSNILPISVQNNYSETCSRVYYKGYFYVDGKRTTVIEIMNIIAALDYIC